MSTPTTFQVVSQPATGHGDVDGYRATCPSCGYVISYSIARMVQRDMQGHLDNYCRGPVDTTPWPGGHRRRPTNVCYCLCGADWGRDGCQRAKEVTQ